MKEFNNLSRGKRLKNLAFLICILIAAVANLYAESFKVNQIIPIPIASNGTTATVTVGLNDSILIELPEDMTFIEGVELYFKFPYEIATNKDMVIWTFYGGLFPKPSTNNLDYSGLKTSSGTFGGTYSLNMKIPVKKDKSLKKDIYSYLVQSVPDVVDGKFFLRLQLSPKYQEMDFSNVQVKISGRAIYSSKGHLTVQADYPDDEKNPYTLIVDGIVAKNDEDIFLAPGVHTVSLVSDYYRNEQRTVTIEQGKYHTLRIDLKSIAPVIKIEAPEGTKVYIDGNQITNLNTQMEISQGEHRIRFVFGNYETIKNISIVNGHSYTVSVSLDAKLTDETY